MLFIAFETAPLLLYSDLLFIIGTLNPTKATERASVKTSALQASPGHSKPNTIEVPFVSAVGTVCLIFGSIPINLDSSTTAPVASNTPAYPLTMVEKNRVTQSAKTPNNHQ